MLSSSIKPIVETDLHGQDNGSSLETENAQLRAALENVQADLAYVRDTRIFPQQQPISEEALVAHTDAVAAKDAAEQMRQMAENAETVAFIFEVGALADCQARICRIWDMPQTAFAAKSCCCSGKANGFHEPE